jgi:hypothetical protein
MGFESFGGVQIFRPSNEVEAAIRDRARSHLFSAFKPGVYRGAEAANRIIHHQFAIYERLLRPLMSKLVSRGAAEFLLFQYDQAWQLLHGKGILDLREREHWAWIEPRLKRAIKFLVELICMADPAAAQNVRDRHEAQIVTESALACAESMVDLAMESDLVHSVFPHDCVVRIFDSGPYDFTIKIEGAFADYDQTFSNRVIRDREARDRFVPWPQFDNHTVTHQRFLDDPFRDAFGMTYGEFIAALISIIDGSQPSLHPSAVPTLFVNRTHVIDELAKSGRQRAAIERAVEGFSITRNSLIAGERVVWKPKQESRAYRRGFFVLPHEDGPHLAFSREMARESLVQLVNWVSYKHLPKEWRTKMTTKALEPLSRDAGIWFEQVVRLQLGDVGILGKGARKTIGSGALRLNIPDVVGELDFLGYQPEERLLVVAEAKMVMTGLEAPYWRDDLNEFVFRYGSYAERFRRKLLWTSTQREPICAALGVDHADAVGGVMLTLYPCIASAFISDFPCISVTEFMLDYEERGRWPYQLL